MSLFGLTPQSPTWRTPSRSWMADGIRDDLEISPRLDCILQDRHVSFLQGYYHLVLDVAIDSPVDAFYSDAGGFHPSGKL
ncbi:uncharacterized protein N7518_002138 [Penicillium psychrosexuale]|uniref:uncharacterized protein n=1 Tax=Penicillium psychrosexuale TaxID=1002107 RepID=UPI0025458ECA|nr:uncharacterized protein N7518_002138 [Penicillium psychrosexuale]KAJ5800070.1 hypothetical protein N7518_002138 [Penicillium psychrosexuale]